jgi:hypothetical protein
MAAATVQAARAKAKAAAAAAAREREREDGLGEGEGEGEGEGGGVGSLGFRVRLGLGPAVTAPSRPLRRMLAGLRTSRDRWVRWLGLRRGGGDALPPPPPAPAPALLLPPRPPMSAPAPDVIAVSLQMIFVPLSDVRGAKSLRPSLSPLHRAAADGNLLLLRSLAVACGREWLLSRTAAAPLAAGRCAVVSNEAAAVPALAPALGALDSDRGGGGGPPSPLRLSPPPLPPPQAWLTQAPSPAPSPRISSSTAAPRVGSSSGAGGVTVFLSDLSALDVALLAGQQ